MTTLAQEIKTLGESARKVHGQDIYIMVARAIAFGNDNNLVIIQGKNHKAAALDFAKVMKGATITEEPATSWPDEEPKIQSVVNWK